MTESFLHYIWKYRLFDANSLQTKTGEKVEILQTGLHNTDSGPDFFNARLRIGDTVWAGNIEIHQNSSDWYNHNHHTDPAYDSIIAHMVYQDDAEIKRMNGSIVPTVRLVFDSTLYSNYENLLKNEQWIHCEKDISSIDETTRVLWIASLAVERLYRKSLTIKQRLDLNQNNWEETFYHFLARGFGFNTNADPFELLAKSIPSKSFSKIKDQKTAIESLLMGQAGFLEDAVFNDEYYENLKKEYAFLRKKFTLRSLDHHLWKLLRIRPSNFPTIRISQFADLIYQVNGMFSTILEAGSIDELRKLFNISASDYWNNHYLFGKSTAVKKKNFGEEAFQLVMINTIVPFLFIYGKLKSLDHYSELAINYLEKLKPETNSIISRWKKLGLKLPDAFHSQAMLELKKEYCQKDRCLDCSFGSKFISLDFSH